MRLSRRLQPADFITPMAAVAGSVAEEILGAMLAAARLDRAYVNNGGDIALHLAGGEQFTVGLMDRPDRHGLMRTIDIDAEDPVRGIATSGRHGRSFSLGIADAVTVLAKTASQADAAATIIANAVDLPGHPAIIRCPANELQPDSDLGARLVTRDVGALARGRDRRRVEGRGEPGAAIACGGIDRRCGLASTRRDGRGGCNRDQGRRAVGISWKRTGKNSACLIGSEADNERDHSQDRHGGRGDPSRDGAKGCAADPAGRGDRRDRESLCRPVCRGSLAADRNRRGTRRSALEDGR